MDIRDQSKINKISLKKTNIHTSIFRRIWTNDSFLGLAIDPFGDREMNILAQYVCHPCCSPNDTAAFDAISPSFLLLLCFSPQPILCFIISNNQTTTLKSGLQIFHCCCYYIIQHQKFTLCLGTRESGEEESDGS